MHKSQRTYRRTFLELDVTEVTATIVIVRPSRTRIRQPVAGRSVPRHHLATAQLSDLGDQQNGLRGKLRRTWMNVCVCVCMYVCVYVCVCVYVYVSACEFACSCACVCLLLRARVRTCVRARSAQAWRLGFGQFRGGECVRAQFLADIYRAALTFVRMYRS